MNVPCPFQLLLSLLQNQSLTVLLTLEMTILLLTVWLIPSLWLDPCGLHHHPNFTLGTSHVWSMEFFQILVTVLEHNAFLYQIHDKSVFSSRGETGPFAIRCALGTQQLERSAYLQ